MELQIYGIYTLKIGIDLIVINKDENNYFIVEIDDFCTRDGVIHFLEENIYDTELFSVIKKNDSILGEIDGYLGKIPNDLLNKLLIQLDKLDWYLYCF